MKANEPEKIYLLKSQNRMLDGWYNELPIPKTFEQVEYTRTDAFIEKACDFISLNVADYIDVTHKGGIEHLALQERFIDEFRKYMKGE